MCTVLIRFDPGAAWPVLLGAVRDEFLGRPWDAPAGHWPATPDLIGGHDRQSGGTWLALDPNGRSVSAILNGPPLPPDNGRPTRGTLPLTALTRDDPLPTDLDRYDTFHLLRARLDCVELWSWDGVAARYTHLVPGDHIIVNLGLDAQDDPLVPYFEPLLRGLPSVDPRLDLEPQDAWDGWLTLLRGDGLDPTDPRALVIRHEYGDRVYGSGSASLVGLSASGVRFDFTPTPEAPAWRPVGTRRGPA